MPISKKISGKLKSSSWIRKMFEEGLRMKKEHGADNVFDLSLGNPVIEPPDKVIQAIKLAANDTIPGLHRYMPNAGLHDVREKITRSNTIIILKINKNLIKIILKLIKIIILKILMMLKIMKMLIIFYWVMIICCLTKMTIILKVIWKLA